MTAAVADAPLVALLGNPNCGKTALFNLLTGARQKVANYAGVTVERKEGSLTGPSGRRLRILDLPGAYSLNAESEDEAVTRDVVLELPHPLLRRVTFVCWESRRARSTSSSAMCRRTTRRRRGTPSAFAMR